MCDVSSSFLKTTASPIRNCFDHGIETSAARLEARKAAHGTIHVACYRQTNGWLHFVIRDDGQGINADKLVAKALKCGVWAPEKAATASYQEKIELAFVPNLSTTDGVNEISGRGVGMDAVRAALSELGGRVSVHSQPGLGTQFELDVPPLTSTANAAMTNTRRAA